MYHLKQLMEMLSIPERTIRRHIKIGILSGTKVGGTWRFSEEDISKYLSNKTIIHTQNQVRMREILDQLNGFNKSKDSFLFVKQLPKMKLKQQKDISMYIKNLNDPLYFHLDNKNNQSILTFRGSEEDGICLLGKVKEILHKE